MTPAYTRTGVRATDGQHTRIVNATTRPYIVVGGLPPQTPQQVAHDCALEQGLPEITGYYGYDTVAHEFLGPA